MRERCREKKAGSGWERERKRFFELRHVKVEEVKRMRGGRELVREYGTEGWGEIG